MCPRYHVAFSVGAFVCDIKYRHGGPGGPADPADGWTRRASLDVGSITNLKSVMAQLKEQHPAELIMAPHMSEKVLEYFLL
jgi:hypothetical protein